MRKRTRLVSILLCLLMLLAAACSTTASTTATEKATAGKTEAREQETQKQTEAAESETEKAAEADDAGAYQPTSEVSFRYWWMNDADIPTIETPIENVPDTWLREKTLAYVEEGFGNGGMGPNVKLETMIAAGTLPDFGVTYNFEGFDRAVETEQAYAMTPEFIQQYAPNAWRIVPKSSWDVVTRNGKIYGVPTGLNAMFVDPETMPEGYHDFYSNAVTRLTWTTGQYFAIRDDILKELFPDAVDFETAWAEVQETNQPVVEKFVLPVYSTDEFVKVFYDIKALNLMESGKPVYAFGYVQGDNWMALTALGGEMVGYKTLEYMTVYNFAEDKLEFGFDLPMVKQAAQLQNQMIRDDVIDPESIVHTIEKYREKYLNGQYGVVSTMGGNMIGYGSFDVLNSELEKAGKPFRYVPFLTQVPNLESYPAVNQVRVAGACSQFLVPMVTMDEEKMKHWLYWVDTQFTDEWDKVRYWGPESAGLYTINADGLPEFTDETLQKAIVEGDTSIDWKECRGLLNYNRANNCNFTIAPYAGSPNAPAFIWRATKPITQQVAFMKFSFDSEYAKDVPIVPAFQSWAPDYAHLPQVNTMFQTRAVWEDAFKLALVAKSDEEFEQKWTAALEIMHESFDIPGLLEGQTPIFQANKEVLETMNIRRP